MAGRPPAVGQPRTEMFKFRLTSEELRRWKEAASKTKKGLSLSELIRRELENFSKRMDR